MNKYIKWIALQPLTGGMYLGAEKAIGHPAELIISFPGIGDAKNDDVMNVVSCGNEYHLMKYLDKVNRRPNYLVFNKNMFEDGDLDVELITSRWTKTTDLNNVFDDIDVVVGVPVCSGLSAATISDSETKQSRNCNMIWLTRYTLNVIKPKIYIFENAPRLFSSAGADVRSQLERIAEKSGYSVLYYKTDTFFHNNAQLRPRTFVIFMQWQNGTIQSPAEFGFEHNTVPLQEMFNRVLSSSTQQFTPIMSETEKMQLKYYNHIAGEKWDDVMGRYSDIYFKRTREFGKFIDFINTQCDEFSEESRNKFIEYLHHCEQKLNDGKNFYSQFIYRPDKNFINAVMFKQIKLLIHPTQNRKLTVREYLTFMGHPQDFEMQGNEKMNYLAQIGQNVPVDTAAFIVSQAVKIVNEWDKVHRKPEKNVMFIDNTKQRIYD